MPEFVAALVEMIFLASLDVGLASFWGFSSIPLVRFSIVLLSAVISLSLLKIDDLRLTISFSTPKYLTTSDSC